MAWSEKPTATRRSLSRRYTHPTKASARRFFEFFTANIRNPNTRRAYARAAAESAAWCNQNGLLQGRLAAPSIKLHLAAIHILFEKSICTRISRPPRSPATSNGFCFGPLEVSQQMANHESARTTSLYDRLP
jgi:hypothetical protein